MPNSPQDLHKKVLGKKGEQLVEEYLKKQGCKILKRNYRTPFGEADLIVEDGDEIARALSQGHIAYVINTRDIDSVGSANDGALIRRYATENNVTIMTSLDTVRVLLEVLEETTLTISTIDS